MRLERVEARRGSGAAEGGRVQAPPSSPLGQGSSHPIEGPAARARCEMRLRPPSPAKAPSGRSQASATQGIAAIHRSDPKSVTAGNPREMTGRRQPSRAVRSAGRGVSAVQFVVSAGEEEGRGGLLACSGPVPLPPARSANAGSSRAHLPFLLPTGHRPSPLHSSAQRPSTASPSQKVVSWSLTRLGLHAVSLSQIVSFALSAEPSPAHPFRSTNNFASQQLTPNSASEHSTAHRSAPGSSFQQPQLS